MTPLRWILLVLLFAVLHVPSSARAVDLVLLNGWTDAPFSTSKAEAFYDNDMVYLKGAVGGGTSGVLFVLPEGLRPTGGSVYVSVDLCNAGQGRLLIQTDGTTTVFPASGVLADAQCFTSLDGVKFASPGIEFDPLTLAGTWVGAPFGTNAPAVALIDGVVHLRGALNGGASSFLFTLPIGLRPATDVYVPVNLCNAAKGRLRIFSSGEVFVDSAAGTLSEAQCFTSLDGVSFAPSDAGFTPLPLASGWSGAPFSTSLPAISEHDGIIRFKGAIAGGSGDLVFTLPVGFRPAETVYLPVDLCFARKGRLILDPNGEVRVVAFANFSDAQCFTSLDGASFVAPPPSAFTPLVLENGWSNGTFGTQTTSVVLYDDIVYFKGAVSGGSIPRLFTLPVGLRPARDVAVAVDLCNAAPGRLYVQASTGHVTVSSPGGFFQAQCFVSLEGASYARSDEGFRDLSLVNGWQTPAFQSDRAGAKLINGLVHLRGAIANGSTGVAFSLPSDLRPSAEVYVSVGLCGGAKGRLRIQSSGVVTVSTSQATFADAQCFTSLDGVKFAPAAAGFANLALATGWFVYPFFTSEPAATMQRDIVHLRGAIYGGTAATVFTLPPVLRPEATAYVPVDLCNGVKGRLVVQPDGTVTILSTTTLADAECFTSLDGASYAVPEPALWPALFAGVGLLAGLSRRTRAQAGEDADPR
jgi:hypothetical protein